MNNKVHIIIAAENGRSRSLVVRKGRIRTALMVTCVLVLVLVASLYVSVTSLLQQHDRRLTVVELEHRVDSLSTQNKQLSTQVKRNEAEKQELLSNAVQHLNERSSHLESILTQVGIEVALKEDGDGENSGGPYIEPSADNSDDALFFSAQLIDILEQTPLGVPCKGYLSSSFGRRSDPFNGRKAFHSGIDIAHFVGTKVKATADGTVVSCGYVSGYGKMVKVAHGDRFTTVFGHLNKFKVKKGAKIARGDVIGTMGNTGRSTGPHLHYEIRDHGRAINPYSFTFLKK
ncbi:MAG: peptidoglycan DD-metalloendopeptidase family protein [Thermodesulfobacteriota bacterium]|nr:peptidoglycan DD-metalloendopeptidase family protein [Thermodesulfobacteriota bacterium]